MLFIHWQQLPRAIRQQLEQRLKERSISEADMILLAKWIRTNPEVPDGEWCKDFGTFVLAGEGPLPKTFLLPGQPCRGRRI